MLMEYFQRVVLKDVLYIILFVKKFQRGINVYGKAHLLFVVFTFAGMLLSSFLIDLDHSGTLKNKWECFWSHAKCDQENMHRGIFHNPAVAFAIIGVTFGISFGYLMHMIMDYVKFIN